MTVSVMTSLFVYDGVTHLQKLTTIQNTEGNGEGILGAHLQSAKVLMIC